MWQETVEGPPGVIEVTVERGFPPGTTAPAVGVSAPEILTIRAVGPGEVTLRLAQRRPWEQGVAPLREHAVVVHVAPAA
jgi:hypothetical protein